MITYNKNFNFQDIINLNKIVLFDFGQDNCTRCKTLENEIINNKLDEIIPIYYVDVKDNMKLVRSRNIYASPCILIFYKGEQVYKNLGTFDFKEVIDKINTLKSL